MVNTRLILGSRSFVLRMRLELNNELAQKRAASPGDKTESLEYLIRGELDRACPHLPKRDGKMLST